MANEKANGTEPPGGGTNRRNSAHSEAGRGGGGTLRKEAPKSPKQDKSGEETKHRSPKTGTTKPNGRQTSAERKEPSINAREQDKRRAQVSVKTEVIEGRLELSDWVGMLGATAEEAIIVPDDNVDRTPKRKQAVMKEGGKGKHSPPVKRTNAAGRVLEFDLCADEDMKEIQGRAQDPIELDGKDAGAMEENETSASDKKKDAKTRKPVRDPYKKAEKTKDDDPTPTKGNKTKDGDNPVTWAQKVNSPQTTLKTHERIKEAHDSYFEAGFIINSMGSSTPMEETITQLREVIRAILLRAKEIDRKSKINPWNDDCELATIVKYEDIPFNPRHLKAYLSPIRMGLGLKAGNNNGWRVRITTRIPRKELLHHWGLSKRDFTKVRYVALREAPLQNSTYHAAGYFLNSSDRQITEELEKEISEKMGFKVGIHYKPAALDKRAADELWGEAKRQKKKAPEYIQNKTFFKHAPFAQQVYAATRAQAHEAATKLSNKYGSSGKDGQYPRLPDGTRMRFIAASIYLDMQGRATAANLFPQQVKFQTMEVTASVPIRDPYQKFPTQGDRTMQQLLLDLKDPEMGEEPYFRHLQRKFHWNHKVNEYEVSIHGQMFTRSAKILRELKKVVTKQYGQEVGEAIMDGDSDEATFDHQSKGGMSGITIATEDRYLNGPAKFIIEGLENVRIDKEKSLTEIRKGEEDAHTMNIRSTTSGFSGETGNTVPDYDAHTTITTTNSHNKGNTTGSNDYGSQKQGTQSTTTNTNTDDQSGSKRNNSNEGWIVKGGAEAATSLAHHVAAALEPRGGRDYP